MTTIPVPLPKQNERMAHIQNAILSHAYEPLTGQEIVSALVMKTTPSQRQEEVSYFKALASSLEKTPEYHRNLVSHTAVFGDLKIKMTQFDELTVYEIIAPRQEEKGVVLTPLMLLPRHWIEGVPGSLVTAFCVDIERCDQATLNPPEAIYCDLLPHGRQFGGVYGKSNIVMVTNLTKNENGIIPFYVLVHSDVTFNELGRFVNRLVLLNAFYMAAMAFLLEKSELMERVDQFDGELRKLSEELEATLETPSDETLYHRLTQLAVQVETLDAGSHRSLHATREYIALVKNLLALIKEERISKVESYQNFLLSTIEPVERSNQLLTSLISSLNKKVFQQNELVRSRIDLRLEAQNQQIFHELKVQANKQIQLQETVEGFSVAAISYYSVSLIGYALKALPESALMGLSVGVIKGIAVPFVVVATYWSMQKIKRKFGLGE